MRDYGVNSHPNLINFMTWKEINDQHKVLHYIWYKHYYLLYPFLSNIVLIGKFSIIFTLQRQCCFSLLPVHYRMTNIGTTLCIQLNTMPHSTSVRSWLTACIKVQGQPWLLKGSSTASGYKCPEWLYWIKIACTVDSLSLRLV